MIKIAIVGCGRIFYKHKSAIEQSLKNKAIITGVCDSNKILADKASLELNVPAFYDINELIKNCSFDLVSILTPSGLHSKHVISFAGKCPYIIVEKPMCLNYEEGLQMVDICSTNNTSLFVVKQNRFNKPVIKLKSAIDNNDLGKIFLGTSRVRWTRTTEYYDQASWRGTWNLDGGVMANQASHHLDLLNWFLGGDPKSVFAKSIHCNKKIQAEDTATVIIDYGDDKLGLFEATTATRPKDLEGSVSILGAKGTVEIGGFAVNELKTWQIDGESELIDQSKYATKPPNVYGFGHEEFYKDIFRCINQNVKPLLTGEEGLKVVKLLNAIQSSIHLKKEINLDQKNFITPY